MKIEQLFKKDITRDIQGVIKIGQKEKENIKQELEEYVVTEELHQHFETFYKAYTNAYDKPTDRMGVWISGFFGSGKSHFLKILSYLLQSNMEIDGKKPVDFFKDKLHNQELLSMMQKVTDHPSDVVLFNIDSKADSDSKQNKTAIVKVFNKVYNEMRGYSASIPWLAELEETLDEKGEYEAFQTYFEEETGLKWSEGREELYYNFDETVTALAKATNSSEESANRWLENGENNYSISVEEFAQRIKKYVDKKDTDYRLIFSVDEVGQYISENTNLMLNLQTVVEDLGKLCNGKVWVIVTSQQDINSLQEHMSSTDFSKIQGRFNTRVSLSSANADEVIKIRLLDKKADAYAKLLSNYDEHAVSIKNKLEFEDAATMQFYKSREDFAKVYPFVPYQFNLLQKVFTGIREHGSAGKHLSDGERNLLESIQQATIQHKEEDLNTLIPFHVFYDNIDQALEHSVRSTIIKANQNEMLSDFDVNVLKLLFLIRYVDEMPGTLKNLTTLMIHSIDEDMIELSNNIKRSLDLLENEFLIQRIGNKYLFLTNEEQDINREIDNIEIPTSEYIMEAGNRLINDVLNLRRFTYQPYSDQPDITYLMDISLWIDDRSLRSTASTIGVRFMTTYSDHYEDQDAIALSQREDKMVIVRLPEEEDFTEIKNYLRINQYLRRQTTQSLTPSQQDIRQRKASERKQLEDVFVAKLKQDISEANIIVNGSEIDISGTPEKRIEKGLYSLVSNTYPKIFYIKKSYSKDELEKLIMRRDVSLLEEYEDKNNEATEEIERYLDMQKERNMVVTLREVLNRYTVEPYGWNDLDILASLVRLIKLEKVQLTLNSKHMNVFENDFMRNIQSSKWQEKIVVAKRKTLNDSIKRKVKELTKDLFNISALEDKEEDMYQTITNRFSMELKELQDKLSLYRENNYPDQQLIRDAITKIERLLSIKDAREFLTQYVEQGDELLDLFEDLEDILEFLNNHKHIYDKAIEQVNLYEKDRNYIENDELRTIYEAEKSIIDLPRPYRKMKELKDWTDQFTSAYTDELESVSKPVHDAIEQDKLDIEQELKAIEGEPEYDKLYRSYKFRLSNVETGLQTAGTVRDLKSFKQESSTIKGTLIHQIEEAKQAIAERLRQKKLNPPTKLTPPKVTGANGDGANGRDGGEVVINQTPPVVNRRPVVVHKDTITPSRMVELNSEEDIDRYLDEMRKTLKKYLDNADYIKLI
ncbi:MAG: BREX system P-loop protein BrxC [Alkalibacterium gilvum]|uniref:BREX system P-loop protein BrxC n=1 Tax=Alkalibacterium gilvum TaxID=1130080 RepID=UPI000EDC72F9|nr:BREX system P-loop protein BrxC [Alkalibacterium sp.]